MIVHLGSLTFSGIDIINVDVQVQISPGIPNFTIVGLADKTIGESKERVRAAREEFTEEEIQVVIRKGTIGRVFFPVLCGSAFKNKGVQPLLDAVVDYLPSPIDIGIVKGININSGEEKDFKILASEPFSALAFKVMTDPFVGFQQGVFAVYQKITKDTMT